MNETESAAPKNRFVVEDARLTVAGFPPAEIFNHQVFGPITLAGTGVHADGKPWEYELLVEPGAEGLAITMRKGTPHRAFAVPRESLYQVLTVDRRLAYLPIGAADRGEASARGIRELIPPDLVRVLFDRQQHREIAWDRFTEVLGRFADLLPGPVNLFYDRKGERARVVFDLPERKRITAHQLGAGTQQIIALLGQTVRANAAILALEEPELGLRYPLQLRLRDALLSLLPTSSTSEGLPQQIFLTSHSDAFEDPADGATFFALTQDDEGTHISRRKKEDARAYIGQPGPAMLEPGDEPQPLCYVTREGRVQLPTSVRHFLRMEEGGGVFFFPEKATGYVRMLTQPQYLDLLEPTADDTSAQPDIDQASHVDDTPSSSK